MPALSDPTVTQDGAAFAVEFPIGEIANVDLLIDLVDRRLSVNQS